MNAAVLMNKASVGVAGAQLLPHPSKINFREIANIMHKGEKVRAAVTENLCLATKYKWQDANAPQMMLIENLEIVLPI